MRKLTMDWFDFLGGFDVAASRRPAVMSGAKLTLGAHFDASFASLASGAWNTISSKASYVSTNEHCKILLNAYGNTEIRV